MISIARFRVASIAVVALVSLTWSATAQTVTPADLLEDFNHYTLTANVELASANAQALLDLPLSDADLATLLDEGGTELGRRFDRAVDRAHMVPELEDIASELARRIEAGRMDLARDSRRIQQAIDMLVGNQRAKLLAKNRLRAAGEYAVPALLRQITEGSDERLKLASLDMMRQIGRHAVTPLCEAIEHLGDVNQRVVCDLLGDIGWGHAAPYLREITLDENAAAPTRAAAARAFANVQGTDTDLSTLYQLQGDDYFRGVESLIAYPDEPANNIWTYDTFVGLVATPVPTSIFSEVMAMRMVAKAIAINPENRAALSLFVGSNLKRENDLAAGDSDPIFGDLNYTPDFYATVFGTQVCQDVLGTAIDVTDTPLIRDAIAALSKTTGGSNLFSGTGRQPLLECMEYPDRRVQYEAALTLGQALPSSNFPGDHLVVPLLASAVRAGNQMFALVVADDSEDQQNIANRLEGLGFSIAGVGSTVQDVGAAIGASAGIDLIVVQRNTADQARTTVEQLGEIARTAVAPILINAAGVDRPELSRDYRANPRVSVVRAGLNENALSNKIEELLRQGAGGRVTDSEADAYAIEALDALRNIAISNTPAYNIDNAISALRDAMDTRSGGVRLLVAEILSLIGDNRAQQKLFDAALVDGDEQQVELLGWAAESVKRFGNQAERRHVDALLDLILNSDGFIAEQAARVHGAMNLPPSTAIDLIPK